MDHPNPFVAGTSRIPQRSFPMTPSPAQIKRRKIRLLWSYLPDWVLCIGLTAAFYALDFVDGFEREFDLTDTGIQHSFTEHERVPNAMLLVFAAAVPFGLLPVINLITIRSWWDLHNSWLGLVLSLSLTGAVSQVVKVLVGRPRPDLIARCLPAPGSANAPSFGLVTSAICTQTNKYIMRDGFRSFPSAHSSLSFAGLGFLSFYLAGKMHLFDRRGNTFKAWLALTPFVGAAVIAITRTMDYRHNATDVMTGSALGALFAFFSYHQYYPSLSSPLSHRPYSPRIPSLKNVPPTDPEHGTLHTSFEQSSEEHLAGHRRNESMGNPPGRQSFSEDTTNSTMHLRPPANPFVAKAPRAQDNREQYEMEASSIDGTVRRPRQDLQELWHEGSGDPRQTS